MKLQTALLFCAVGALALSTPAIAEGHGYNYGYRDLGGVNLNYYCSKTFGSGFKSILIGQTAGDRRCQQYKSKGEPKSISVQDACKLQYGKEGLTARALSWNNPLSWRCFEFRKPKNPR